MEHVTGTVLADAAAAGDVAAAALPGGHGHRGMPGRAAASTRTVGVATARGGWLLQRQLARGSAGCTSPGRRTSTCWTGSDALLTGSQQNAPSCTGLPARNISSPRTATCARCSTGNWRLAVIRSPTWGGRQLAAAGDGSPPVTAAPGFHRLPSREEPTPSSPDDVSELPYPWRSNAGGQLASVPGCGPHEAGVMGDDGFSAQLREQHEVELAGAAKDCAHCT